MKNIQHYSIFLDENLYSNQINWIIKQIESFKDNSFNNYEEAQSNLEKISTIQLGKGLTKKQLRCNLAMAEKSLHEFRNSFLSEQGFTKLNTTLKVARKRSADKANKAQKLDVTISEEAFNSLNEVVKKTGLTKTAIIEQLILNNENINLFKLASNYFI